MSWKVHETDEVFAALRGLCSNSYRMYDPCEYRYYYDHECDAYECVVEEAAEEYERLLMHCNHQREELSKLMRYVQGEAPAETIDLLMELLNEYRESGCAIDESRVSWYARRLGGRTMNERMTNDERTSGAGITDELREYAVEHECDSYRKLLNAIADRIDAEYAAYRAAVYAIPKEYVKLPTDADGIPIHTGDLMEADGDVFNVMSMELFYDGSWSIRNDVGNGFEYWELHHVKPDSWERIIADAVKNGMYDHDNERIQQKLVERCRRLAGDAE